MNIGCKAKLTILSAGCTTLNDGRNFYRLAVLGSDGEAGNLDCNEEVYKKVNSDTFLKMKTYECQLSYVSGQSQKGRFQFVRVIGVGNEVK